MNRAVSRLDRFFTWCETRYLRAVELTGLSGSDKRLSFSKTFGILILASYAMSDRLPPSVAIALIISAHGTKVLLEAIKAGVFRIGASDSRVTTKTETKVETHAIDERRGWNAEREYQES